MSLERDARKLVKQGEITAAAELFERAGKFERAAELFIEGGGHAQAARCYEHVGLDEEAALNHARAGDSRAAAEAYRRAGNARRAALLFERAGEFASAAEIYRAEGDAARAGQCYERLNEWQTAGEMYEQAREHLPAGECFLRSGFPARAARCFEEAGAIAHAARAWTAAKDLRRAAQLFSEADQPLASASAYFKNNDHGEALRMLRDLETTHTDFYDGMHLMFAVLAERGYLTPLDEKTVRGFLELGVDPISLPAFLDLYRLYLICELKDEAEDLAARIRSETGSTAEVERALEALHEEYAAEGQGSLAGFEQMLVESFDYQDTADRMGSRRSSETERTPPEESPPPAPDPVPEPIAARAPTLSFSAIVPGHLFDGRYRIERKLGAGGIGAVFLAHDQSLDEHVALKILKPMGDEADDILTRFKQEIRITRRIVHPNVVRTYDFGESGDLAYVAMEHVDGHDLKHMIRSHGAVPADRTIAILLDVCDGLTAAHELGVVHRDIKPQNILIDLTDRARLIDFGIAKLRDSVTSTMTEMFVGTPEYLSPEMALGTAIDQRTDIYSFGVVMYEMLCGQVPFSGSTLMAVLSAHLREQPVPIHERNAGVPAELEAIALRCLAKQAEHRYGSVPELRDAICAVRGPRPD